jgi:AcrR family transcriptional regulator
VTRHGQDRRATILRQAELLFMERGYANTHMAAIAREAGVTKGLVYWYFETKEALFQQVAVDMRRRLRQTQGDAIAGIDDPLERLYVGIVESVRFIAEHHRLYEMISALRGGDRELRATQARSRQVMAEDAAALLAEGQDRGVIRPDEDPVALARANSGVVWQHVLLYVDRPQPGSPGFTVDETAHAAGRYVVRAVAASDADADRVIKAQAAD